MNDALLSFKQELDTVSPTFCLAKWLRVTLHLGIGHTHSCHHPRSHKIPIEELKDNPSALHNTDKKKCARKQMLAGEAPTECEYCWSIERQKNSGISDRIIKSYDWWSKDLLDDIASLPPDANVNPTYVEISFNNTCNFKCSYCSPEFSSRWLEEINKNGPYRITADHQMHSIEALKASGRIPLDNSENPYISAFWDWWPQLVQDLKILRITGGEPLLDSNTFKLLERFIAVPRPELSVGVNTNLGVPSARLRQFYDTVHQLVTTSAIKSFHLFTSVDTWGEQAAYIRHGLDFNTFLANIEVILSELPAVNITIMCTFNALSVPNFRLFLENYIALKSKYLTKESWSRVHLNMDYLRHPELQSVLVLPSDYLVRKFSEMTEFVENHTSNSKELGLTAHEVLKFNNVKSHALETEMNNRKYHMASFYRYFKEHDRRRQTNFIAAFPELETFWDQCQSTSEEFSLTPSQP